MEFGSIDIGLVLNNLGLIATAFALAPGRLGARAERTERGAPHVPGGGHGQLWLTVINFAALRWLVPFKKDRPS